MLTFSQRMEEEKKPLQLSSIVEETVKLLGPSLPATISIRVSVKSESGPIIADPAQIQQVLTNLAANAVQAMGEKGGVLGLEVSAFSVAPSGTNPHGIGPGDYMKLVVRDTGIGMPPEVMEGVFDPFFTTKGVGKGTGLGLSVVYGIVTQAHGYITVDSEPGKGSTFTIYFPKAAEGPATEPATEDVLPAGFQR
jgi:signal transduction histidine kinase